MTSLDLPSPDFLQCLLLPPGVSTILWTQVGSPLPSIIHSSPCKTWVIYSYSWYRLKKVNMVGILEVGTEGVQTYLTREVTFFQLAEVELICNNCTYIENTHLSHFDVYWYPQTITTLKTVNITIIYKSKRWLFRWNMKQSWLLQVMEK